MDYPFKKIEHCIYRNTFLQETIIEFEFEDISKNNNSNLVSEHFNSFVKSSFGIELSDSNLDLSNRHIVISSQDTATKYVFENNKIQLRIGSKVYKSFNDSVIPNIKKIEDFFDKVLPNKQIYHSSLRKINLLPIQNIPEGTSLKIILDKIFSKELLVEENQNLQNDDINTLVKWEKEKNFRWKDYDIIIRYGFKNQQIDDKDCILLLDIEVRNSTASNINDVPLKEYNDIIFDAYHWAINASVLQLMNKKE